MANALGEECKSAIQTVINEVFGLFALMARHEWLSWGGELLFPDLQDEVEQEEQEAEAKRQMEEQEAEGARKQSEEELARQAAADVRADQIAARKVALGKLEEEGEDEVDAKRAKFVLTGLLDFKGPVCLIFR
jgi:hypothetical protein